MSSLRHATMPFFPEEGMMAEEDMIMARQGVLKGTLVQIQLCIVKEKILTAARQRGYRFKQKLTLPNGRSRIHLDAKITERFMT